MARSASGEAYPGAVMSAVFSGVQTVTRHQARTGMNGVTATLGGVASELLGVREESG